MPSPLRHEHQHFHYRTSAELRGDAAALGLELPFSTNLQLLGQPLQLDDGRTVPNRFVLQPMAGFDADTQGTPGPLAYRRYQRYAAGGAGLIWFEATAVVSEGRSNPQQFWLHADNVGEFKRLVEVTRATARQHHGHEPLLILQLTHSGRYSKPSGTPQPLIAQHSPLLDPLTQIPAAVPVVSDDYLDTLHARFAEAACLAREAGFDGVDVQSCHRFLLSELLGSFTRDGNYGGSFENRTRLLRDSFAAILAMAPELLLTTRLNAYDAIAYPDGWGVSSEGAEVPDLTEPLQLIGELRRYGMPLINISIGNPYNLAHYGHPYDLPIKGGGVPAEHSLRSIHRLLGITRTIQRAYPDLPVVGSGYSWLRHLLPEVAAGVLEQGDATLIGLGRQAVAYPDAPRDILSGQGLDPDKCCVACSASAPN